MAAKHIAWSFSRLHTYEECAKQFYHLFVAPRGHPDKIEYEQNDQGREGDRVHKALDVRVSSRTPLPDNLAHLEPMCQTILEVPGRNFTEMKLAIDQAFEPCGGTEWDRVWLRVIIDLLKINGDWAWVADYKTGKRKTNDDQEDQLKLTAATTFLLFPEVDRVTSSYLWTKHHDDPKKFATNKDYTRDQAPELWSEFIPRQEKLQIANAAQHWPANPTNKSICMFCSVNKAGKCPVALAEPWKPR